MMALRVFAPLAALLATSAVAAVSAEPSFVPVYQGNFPDPFITLHNGEFIAYSTNDGPNLPMLTSLDLVHWNSVATAEGRRIDGMPRMAPWAKADRTWAPEVIRIGDNWLLYYTAASAKKSMQCIGVAVAEGPKGPFVDTSEEPLICQTDEGGSIDPDPFRDADGNLYLYYKSDGNAVGKHSFIWGQRLSDDGLKLVGQPVALASDDKNWEWQLVEAPSMVKSPNGYQLFYSAAFYGWDYPKERLSNYATGYADCAGPLGPCSDAADNPLLHSFNDRQAGCLSGPGHPAIFQVGKQHFMAFHAWAATQGCRPLDSKRYLYVAPLFWKDNKPHLGPSLRVQAGAERR